MLKQGKLTAGVPVVLVKPCRYAIVLIVNYPIKNPLSLSLKKLRAYIYVAVRKPQHRHFATIMTASKVKTMAIEIEHKFLLANDDWRACVSHSIRYRQGYLSSQATSSIRVRSSDNHAWLNIKSATIGTHRHEYEYEIPLTDAHEILDKLCRKPLIEKTRYFVQDNEHTWEIDEFDGDNQGLIVAEIELSEIGAAFVKPAWIGAEVTDDLRYYNNNLSQHPYSEWKN
jgi:adenylate cyclase